MGFSGDNVQRDGDLHTGNTNRAMTISKQLFPIHMQLNQMQWAISY